MTLENGVYLPLCPPAEPPPPLPCDAPPEDDILPIDLLVAVCVPLLTLEPPPGLKPDEPELVEPLDEMCAPAAVRNPPLDEIMRAD